MTQVGRILKLIQLHPGGPGAADEPWQVPSFPGLSPLHPPARCQLCLSRTSSSGARFQPRSHARLTAGDGWGCAGPAGHGHVGNAGGTWDVVPLCFTSALAQELSPNAGAAWAAPLAAPRGPLCVRMDTGRIQGLNPRQDRRLSPSWEKMSSTVQSRERVQASATITGTPTGTESHQHWHKDIPWSCRPSPKASASLWNALHGVLGDSVHGLSAVWKGVWGLWSSPPAFPL